MCARTLLFSPLKAPDDGEALLSASLPCPPPTCLGIRPVPAGSAKAPSACSGEGVQLQMLLGLYRMWSHVASILSSEPCWPIPGRMSCCYT